MTRSWRTRSWACPGPLRPCARAPRASLTTIPCPPSCRPKFWTGWPSCSWSPSLGPCTQASAHLPTTRPSRASPGAAASRPCWRRGSWTWTCRSPARGSCSAPPWREGRARGPRPRRGRLQGRRPRRPWSRQECGRRRTPWRSSSSWTQCCRRFPRAVGHWTQEPSSWPSVLSRPPTRSRSRPRPQDLPLAACWRGSPTSWRARPAGSCCPPSLGW
mmetsp:Transcript_449/g.1380  ORF Transcript_449/g.1380 Transcript_449/m.1380 type:complete len:216 (-) Transcript_449:1265-1912(-)